MCMCPGADSVLWANIHTGSDTDVDVCTHNYRHTAKHTEAACSEQVLLGPRLLKPWLQHTGQITREISLSEGNSWPWLAHEVRLLLRKRESGAVGTNTPPNPCWSQHSREMKCKKEKHSPPPPPQPSNLFPPFRLFSYFLPSQERCHFHYSHGKVLSALVSKCCEKFGKSLKVTLHLSTLSGTYPVHSSLRESKNYR